MTDDTKWHAVKNYLNSIDTRLDYNERDVWRCAIGYNIGFEENGKGEYFERPVVVVKKFNKELFIGIPLTSTLRTGRFYYATNVQGVEGAAILSQVGAFDSKRLLRRIGRVTKKEMIQIKLQLASILGINGLEA